MELAQLKGAQSKIVPVREVIGVDFANAMPIHEGRQDMERQFF